MEALTIRVHAGRRAGNASAHFCCESRYALMLQSSGARTSPIFSGRYVWWGWGGIVAKDCARGSRAMQEVEGAVGAMGPNEDDKGMTMT
ncbi:hypothetical protein K3495_g2010 [Podosphaera aphanis]|nr:hypothetical protein K3495_g2010 [Podosphaera aphanis]